MASLGLNVAADGRHDAVSLRALNVTWARIVHRRDIDVSDRLAEYQANGISTLLVFDRTSVEAYPSAADAFSYALRRYGQYVGAWEIGNEPDQDSPSSWTMPAEQLVDLGRTARACLPDRLIICGGLASGQPSYLVGQDLSWCDAVGVHPYLKDAPNPNDIEDLPDVDVLVSEYMALGKQVWVTEWGWWSDDEQRGHDEIDDMIAWAAKTRSLGVFCYFCADDAMVAPFGLYREDGSPKPSADAFMARAAGAVPVPLPTPGHIPATTPAPEPPPTPEPLPDPFNQLSADDASLMDIWTSFRQDVPFAPESAIGRLWRTAPSKFGPPVGIERYDRAEDGTPVVAIQSFASGARLRWTAGTAEAEVA